MEYVYRSDAWIDSARRSGPGPSGTTSTSTVSAVTVVDEEVEVIPRWPFREHSAPEPVKIAVKLASKAERATAAA